MTKLKLIVVVLGVLVALSSCMKPTEPTNVQILTGEWEIVNVIADGEINLPDQAFMENSVLHLDRNETFLFINVDGRAVAGTWTANETKLTLKGKDQTMVYNIVYLDYDKLHVYNSFTNLITGEIEVRYLFNRVR